MLKSVDWIIQQNIDKGVDALTSLDEIAEVEPKFFKGNYTKMVQMMSKIYNYQFQE